MGGSSKSNASNATNDNDIMVAEGGTVLQDESSQTIKRVGIAGKMIEAGGSDQSDNDGVIQGANSVSAEKFTNLDNGSVLANEISSVKRNSENVGISGSSNIVNQFGDSAAGVVNKAIDAIQSITSKNLQLQTNKDLLREELNAEKIISFDDVKKVFENPKIQLASGVIGAGVLVAIYRKGKK